MCVLAGCLSPLQALPRLEDELAATQELLLSPNLYPGPGAKTPVRGVPHKPSSSGPESVVWAKGVFGWWPARLRTAADPKYAAALAKRGASLVVFLGDAPHAYVVGGKKPEASSSASAASSASSGANGGLGGAGTGGGLSYGSCVDLFTGVEGEDPHLPKPRGGEGGRPVRKPLKKVSQSVGWLVGKERKRTHTHTRCWCFGERRGIIGSRAG